MEKEKKKDKLNKKTVIKILLLAILAAVLGMRKKGKFWQK